MNRTIKDVITAAIHVGGDGLLLYSQASNIAERCLEASDEWAKQNGEATLSRVEKLETQLQFAVSEKDRILKQAEGCVANLENTIKELRGQIAVGHKEAWYGVERAEKAEREVERLRVVVSGKEQGLKQAETAIKNRNNTIEQLRGQEHDHYKSYLVEYKKEVEELEKDRRFVEFKLATAKESLDVSERAFLREHDRAEAAEKGWEEALNRAKDAEVEVAELQHDLSTAIWGRKQHTGGIKFPPENGDVYMCHYTKNRQVEETFTGEKNIFGNWLSADARRCVDSWPDRSFLNGDLRFIRANDTKVAHAGCKKSAQLAWLVEATTSPLYLDCKNKWTTDPHRATRFATQADASEAINHIGIAFVSKPVEHVFYAAEPPKEACGFVPPTPGYLPCTRTKHFDGTPCAHPRDFNGPPFHE